MNSLQCRMARTATGLGIRELAELAEVSPNTIARLERGDSLKSSTIEAIRYALENSGVEFIEENGGGPGVRLSRRIPKCPKCGLDMEPDADDAICNTCSKTATGEEFEKYRKEAAKDALDIGKFKKTFYRDIK